MSATLGAMFGGEAGATFLGLPSCDGATELPADIRAVILGADTATPYARVGAYCAGGAAAIRAGAADFAANRGHVNFDLGRPVLGDELQACDAGDVVTEADDAAGNRARIANATRAAAASGAVPLWLGGDDSLPIPVLEALGEAFPTLWVVQVDAHIDWRDEVDGERLGLSSPMRRASEMSHVAGIVQAGARGIGSARPSDVADARAAGARLFPMRELARAGPSAVPAAVPEGANVALCFDFDVLDPSVMPAVIARAPGGMGYWTAVELIAGLAERTRIRAATFAEFMPARDIDGQGARTAAGLVMATLGLVAPPTGAV